MTDNVLYYNDPDAVTKGEAYALPVSLIVCDLVSYALCYGIVARLTGDPISVVPARDVAWSVGLFLGVEALHFLWCFLALAALRDEPDTDPRKRLLELWRRLSGTWAAVWLVGTAVLAILTKDHMGPRNVDFVTAAIVLAVSVASAYHYLRRLRAHYMGRAIVAPV